MRNKLILVFLLLSFFAVAQKKPITLEDIWQKNTFKIKSVPGFNAMKDGITYTQLDREENKLLINVYDLATGNNIKTLFDNSQTKAGNNTIDVEEYSFSKDEQKMLLLTESKNIYRRSVLHKVYVFDLKTGSIAALDKEKVLHASFSPDGNQVAFVKENNLYVFDIATKTTTAITQDGKKNEIINGNCDWVYEEEFGFTKAYEWAPDGKHIAFYRFDERPVPEYTMTVYDSLYPTPYKYKYPKAGQLNSVIQIKIYDLAQKTFVNADLGKDADQYIPRIKWTNDANKLCILKMNRHQNSLKYFLADAATGHSFLIYKERNPYYIEVDDNIRFLPDNESFVFNSEQSGFNHFYRWNWVRQQLTTLTSGNYETDQLIGIDEKRKLIYYTAAANSPLERQLYSVDWNGEHQQLLTPEAGTHSITSIEGNRFFLDKFSTLNEVPIYYLRNRTGKIIRTLEDNHELKEKMTEYDLGKISFKKIPAADGKTLLNAWIMTPSHFDSTKKYPVLMFQYSGPGSQQVADRFPVADFFWHQMLAEKGYVIVCVDPRGTGMRGEAFKKCTYQQLGKIESDDQIAAAKYLGTLAYVDKDRIGIWGWSYGGFMSSTCIFKGNEVFKMAIAVAPVTNWRYYDNIYTERYMRTPQENPDGYDNNAPEKMAAQLKGKFLVIHGTGDDNVHFQNQVSLLDALIKANKDFDSEYYPNKAHSISGAGTRLHLYRRMTEFIERNL
jgi:dipeptidyl-peptidase-4